jgi:ATP synthase I subunit
MTTTSSFTARESPSAQELLTERRASWLTLVIGFSAAMTVGALRHYSWAIGLFFGTGLAWLNFRWLRRGLDTLVSSSTTQAGAARPRVPLGTYFAAAFRYALIGLAVYVIFKTLNVPLVSMILGLCALGAATIAASVYEVWRPVKTGD